MGRFPGSRRSHGATAGRGLTPAPEARALVFGDDAESYDRLRPGYPAELVDDLLQSGPLRVLDVGCGTGRVARLLAERGCSVLGVEPDPRMAALASNHGVAVELSLFEEWDAADRQFDLVVSGQAWHWIDQIKGPARAADVLTPGGVLAVFWNAPSFTDSVADALAAAYRSREPDLLEDSAALGTVGDRTSEDADAIRASGKYAGVGVRRYSWQRVYTIESLVAELQTHSGHRLLPENRRTALMRDVAASLAPNGPSITVAYETQTILAHTRRVQ